MDTAVGAVCPVSSVKVSATAARINGVIVTMLLTVALFVPAPWVLTILVADFSVKVFLGFRVSPICTLSRAICGSLGLPARPTDQAPKRFAAELGLVFSTAGLVLGAVSGPSIAYYVVVGAFAVCAALEGVAGFCVGCVIYQSLPTWARRRPTARFDRG